MRTLTAVALALGSSSILALAAYGCSSSSSGPVPTGPCQGPGCADSGMQQDTGASKDAGPTEDVVGDGPHDGAAPDALYGACARQGSFGWPCSLTASGPDTTDCTDPAYTQCFVGGQGAWCTKTCTSATDCTMGVEDAGCIPTGCNARGYCK
ncbi:MAG TPA: hypothetical protein VF765_07165 [Polyangiaceae bacterium]